MSILLANDDGINAPGLENLIKALKGIDEIFVAAPETNQSGVGMAINIHKKIKVTEYPDIEGGIKRIAVHGTPADAVKYALQCWLKEKPRLIVSGINYGPNLGKNIRCSGTLGAAFEALITGIPAVAISTGYVEPPYWETAKYYAKIVVEKTLTLAEKQKDFVLNLNVPAIEKEKIKGVALVKHGMGGYTEILKKLENDNDQYQMAGVEYNDENGKNTDADLFAKEYVTINPLKFPMNNKVLMEKLADQWKDIINENYC